MRAYLQRIATGPHMSKDLTADEVEDAMELILSGFAEPVQAAVFFIALRMKRETEDENAGALRALRARTGAARADVDNLVELGDPHDGFARHLPASPFLPAVLAECGLPALSHGCRELPPKRGVTVHRVLAAAGIAVDMTPADAAVRIADPDLGWAYVDVAQSCPPLHRLVALRDQIVKRPLLSTLEKLMGPVRGRRNHLVVGFVHTGYDDLLASMARVAGYDSMLAIKGLEGGVIPSLTSTSNALGFRATGVPLTAPIDPAAVGIEAAERAAPIPDGVTGLDAIAALAAQVGIAALEGARGLTREALVHAGSAILAHVGAAPNRPAAAARIRAALDDGSARARFR